MRGAFIVERKLAAFVADGIAAAWNFEPCGGMGCPNRRGLLFPVGRGKRIARQDVFDVHQQQFLMLLLVIEPQFEQPCDFRKHGVVSVVNEFENGVVDVGAIVQHLVEAWPCQQAALGSFVLWSDRIVVGIEQHLEGRVEFLIAVDMGDQDEGFEKPIGMREMPFRRTHVRHRLNLLVFRRQRCGQSGAGVANLAEHFCQCIARRCCRRTAVTCWVRHRFMPCVERE